MNPHEAILSSIVQCWDIDPYKTRKNLREEKTNNELAEKYLALLSIAGYARLDRHFPLKEIRRLLLRSVGPEGPEEGLEIVERLSSLAAHLNMPCPRCWKQARKVAPPVLAMAPGVIGEAILTARDPLIWPVLTVDHHMAAKNAMTTAGAFGALCVEEAALTAGLYDGREMMWSIPIARAITKKSPNMGKRISFLATARGLEIAIPTGNAKPVRILLAGVEEGFADLQALGIEKPMPTVWKAQLDIQLAVAKLPIPDLDAQVEAALAEVTYPRRRFEVLYQLGTAQFYPHMPGDPTEVYARALTEIKPQGDPGDEIERLCRAHQVLRSTALFLDKLSKTGGDPQACPGIHEAMAAYKDARPLYESHAYPATLAQAEKYADQLREHFN